MNTNVCIDQDTNKFHSPFISPFLSPTPSPSFSLFFFSLPPLSILLSSHHLTLHPLHSEHNQQQLEDLREQLHMLAAQRDDAFLQLSGAQEEASRKAEALHNLQAVLEQFQKGIAVSFTILHSRPPCT